MELSVLLLGFGAAFLLLGSSISAWFLARKPLAPALDEIQQLKAQLQQGELETVRLFERVQYLQSSSLIDQQRAEQIQHELEQRVDSLTDHLRRIGNQLAAEKEARVQEQKNADEKLALLAENKAQLLQEFKALSQEIYEQKQKQFAEQSQQGLSSLLNPFKDQLEGLRKRVDEVHTAETRDRVELRTQIESLHKLNQAITEEAKALTTALRGENKTQGNWGEMILETVLERSGLRKDIEYVREQSLRDDDNKAYRPDVVINLPEGKHLIIDSKVSLSAYTDYVNATDDAERERFAKKHVDSVSQHIKELGDKAYQKLTGINAPDFVFLFMPVEPAFMLAFQRDEKLFETAFDKRIVVVTPTTLLATLRTVNSIWTLERRNRSTEKLADQASKVYDKLVGIVESFEKLGKQMKTAQDSYEDVWGKLKTGRGNLISLSTQFMQLGVKAKKELSRELVDEALEQDGQLSLTETTEDTQ